jgi:hypothetical protein
MPLKHRRRAKCDGPARRYRHLHARLRVAANPSILVPYRENAKAIELHGLTRGESAANPLDDLLNQGGRFSAGKPDVLANSVSEVGPSDALTCHPLTSNRKVLAYDEQAPKGNSGPPPAALLQSWLAGRACIMGANAIPPVCEQAV